MRTARQKLKENVSDSRDVMLIDDEAFRESLVGITEDKRAVYDFDKMIMEYAKYYFCPMSEARAYIEEYIVSKLMSMGNKAPIIMDALL